MRKAPWYSRMSASGAIPNPYREAGHKIKLYYKAKAMLAHGLGCCKLFFRPEQALIGFESIISVK